MKLKSISIHNFRLLEDININIEDDLTLIVGKNNTGKTSLFEIINLFLGQDRRHLMFEDFSKNIYQNFTDCLNLYNDSLTISDEKLKESKENDLIKSMPSVQLKLCFEYDKLLDSLIDIGEFITDLDDSVNEVSLTISYESKNSLGLFETFCKRKDTSIGLLRWLKDNIESYFHLKCYAGDNSKPFSEDINFKQKIRNIICFETIQANRDLADTHTDKSKTLQVGFSDYYKESNKENDTDVEQLETTLSTVSSTLSEQYKLVLKSVLEELKIFGIQPYITIPEIEIKSVFNSESIIKNNLRYYYKNGDIELPENYNGLGYSNLIYLVLKVLSYIEKFKKPKLGFKSEILVIMIEEPEAHLHPQMQQVFISQIRKSIQKTKLTIQLIMSTHSSHIIAEAGIDLKKGFERIRYFSNNKHRIEIKDFNHFKHKNDDKETYRFLKQYMQLHKCDIFFSDKVIMVEGITEKILLPIMINKVAPELENEFVSILEVGGAYTHKFKDILNFIGVKTLIITDIDSVNPDMKRKACETALDGAVTSNATLTNWIPKKNKISELVLCTPNEKTDKEGFIRVAYQIADNKNGYVGRSLEEAILNKNISFFKNSYQTTDEKVKYVKDSFELLKNEELSSDWNLYELSPDSKDKSQFAFDLMTFDYELAKTDWEVPLYIKEGLEWLVKALNSNKQ